jgi:large subunit ribosomal protein L10
MALSRTEKDELIATYSAGMAQAPHAFLLGYKGITVPQVTELRNRVRTSGGQYIVVKNTLALRAIEHGAMAALKDHFVGPTAVVWSHHDPVALAKALTDFAKDVPAIEFKAGLVEKHPVAAAQIKDIAQMPSRNELIAKLLFLIQSPIVRLARVLAAVPQSFVAVLDQVRIKREEGGAAEAGASGETPAAPPAPPAASETPETPETPENTAAEAN